MRKDAALQYKTAPAAQALANYFRRRDPSLGAGRARRRPGPQSDHAPPSGCIAQPSIVPFIARQKSRFASTPTRIPVSAPSRMPARRRTASASRRAASAPTWAVELFLPVRTDCFALRPPPPPKLDSGATFAACGAAVGYQAGLGGTTEITPCINTAVVACEHPVTALCRSNACQLPMCVHLVISLVVKARGARVSRRLFCRDLQAVTFGGLGIRRDAAERLPDSLGGVHRRRPGMSIGLRRHLLLQCHPTRFQPQCPVPVGNLHAAAWMPGHQRRKLSGCFRSGLPAGQSRLSPAKPGGAAASWDSKRWAPQSRKCRRTTRGLALVQTLVGGSYAPGCWYSYNACPSMICQTHGNIHKFLLPDMSGESHC